MPDDLSGMVEDFGRMFDDMRAGMEEFRISLAEQFGLPPSHPHRQRRPKRTPPSLRTACPKCRSEEERTVTNYKTGKPFWYCDCGYLRLEAIRVSNRNKIKYTYFRGFKWFRRLVGGVWYGFGCPPGKGSYWWHDSELGVSMARPFATIVENYDFPKAKALK